MASLAPAAARLAAAVPRAGAVRAGSAEPRAGGASQPLRGAAAARGSAASPGPVRSSPLVFFCLFVCFGFFFSFPFGRQNVRRSAGPSRFREPPFAPRNRGPGRARARGAAASPQRGPRSACCLTPRYGLGPARRAGGTAAFAVAGRASRPGCPRREPGGGRWSGPGVMTRFLSSRRGSALESAAAAAAEPAGAGGKRGGRKAGRKETSGGGARRGDAAVTPLSVGALSDPHPDRCAERRSALRRGEGRAPRRAARRSAGPPRACGSSAAPGSASRRCGARRPPNKLERCGRRESRAPGGTERLRLASPSPGAGPGARETPAPSGSSPEREPQPLILSGGWARGASTRRGGGKSSQRGAKRRPPKDARTSRVHACVRRGTPRACARAPSRRPGRGGGAGAAPAEPPVGREAGGALGSARGAARQRSAPAPPARAVGCPPRGCGPACPGRRCPIAALHAPP